MTTQEPAVLQLSNRTADPFSEQAISRGPNSSSSTVGRGPQAGDVVSSQSSLQETSSSKNVAVDKKVDSDFTEKTGGPCSWLDEAASNLDLPEAQKKVLYKLKDLHQCHMKLEWQYHKEWNKLKQEYFVKYQPLYEARRQLLVDDGEEGGSDEPATTGTKNIPNFWLKAMKNHRLLADLIEEYDEPILAHLVDIRFQWLDPVEQTSFKFDFHFATNPYFKNSVLTKTYHLERAEDDDKENILTCAEGTTIDWYPEKNVTERTVLKKQRHRRTNEFRVLTEVIEEHSFFNYFRTHDIPTEEQLENMDESEVGDLEVMVEAEFELGLIFRDKIIPRALGWYLGIEKDEEDEKESCGSVPEEAEEEYQENEEES